jgi:hypothetical protein
MQPSYFTFNDKPKPVYFLSKLKIELYPKIEYDEFINIVKTTWVSNENIVIIDDINFNYENQIDIKNEIQSINNIIKHLDNLQKNI